MSVGSEHVCVLMSSSAGVRCWGLGDAGALGNGGTSNILSPPSTNVITGVSVVSAGYAHTCVLMTSSSGVRCWGWEENGRLGNGGSSASAFIVSPPSTDIITGVSRVVAGGAHTCVLMSSDGGVRCWGHNGFGNLGIGTTVSVLSPPTTSVLVGASQLALGEFFTCTLMSVTSSVRCWGMGASGALGNGGTADVTSPPSSGVITGVSRLAALHRHTCVVVTSSSGLHCWGDNTNGGLGTGATTQLNSPPATAVLTGVRACACVRAFVVDSSCA